MNYLPGCTAKQRRALVRLRLRVEAGGLSDFDQVGPDGAWTCPLCDPVVGRPNYGPPEYGRLHAPGVEAER